MGLQPSKLKPRLGSPIFFYLVLHPNTPNFYQRLEIFFLSSYPETKLWNIHKRVVWWAKSYCHLSTPTFKGRHDKWNPGPLIRGQIKYALKIDRTHTHHSPHCSLPIYQLSPSDNSPQPPMARYRFLL